MSKGGFRLACEIRRQREHTQLCDKYSYEFLIQFSLATSVLLLYRSTCGSVLELRPDIEYFPLKDKNNKSMFSANLFYVGQTLCEWLLLLQSREIYTKKLIFNYQTLGFLISSHLDGPVNELENAKWITQTPEMRASRKHKAERKFIVQSVEIDGVYVHWQCKASCEDTAESENAKNNSAIPKSYITGDDLQRLKRLNLFESCMLQINDKNYLIIEESDVIDRKSQWKKEQSEFEYF